MFGLGKYHESDLLEAVWTSNRKKVNDVLHAKVSLLNRGASRTTCRYQPEFSEGDTPLHLAARRGDRRIVELLLSLKAHVNAINTRGVRSLHYVCSEGHDEIAQMLLEGGADLDARDDDSRTALQMAAMGGHEIVTRLLLKHGAEVNIKDHEGNTPLHAAARSQSELMVKMLASSGAIIDERNDHERTALHIAIVSADHSAASHVDPRRRVQRDATRKVVHTLLSLGAEVNAVDSLGETPLDVLSYLEGDVETDPVVELLRTHGGEWLRYRNRHAHAATAGPKATAATSTVSSEPATVQVEEAAPTTTHQREPIALGKWPLTIGRSGDCNVRYRSLTLSRKHARINPKGAGYLITDLGSHNGTLINGQEIQRPHLLRPGEIITLGAYEFEFDGIQLMPISDELADGELNRERKKQQASPGDTMGKTAIPE